MASARSRDWFEKQTLGELPARAAARWAERAALCFKGRRFTFAELAAAVDRAAKGMLALGIRPGDKVALWMLNRPEWIAAAFAVMIKIPRHVFLVDDFPMTSSGKIQKIRLRDEALRRRPPAGELR